MGLRAITHRPARGVAAVGAAALLLQGCATLAPKYVRPTPPVPAALPQGDAYAPAEPAPRPAAELAWRDFIVDPKLRALEALALANNRDLRVAVLNVAASHAQFRVQRADLFPEVDASATALYEHTPFGFGSISGAGGIGAGTTGAAGTTTGGGAAGGAGSNSGSTGVGGVTATSSSEFVRLYSIGLGVSSYELDLWGRVRSLTKQAFEQYLSTAEARRTAQISLISEVATDYLTYAADLEHLDIAKDTLAADTKTLDLTKARFNGGIASQLDVRQAETSVDQARSDVANYTTVLAQDANAATLLVGAPIPAELLPSAIGDTLPTLADVPAGLSSTVLLDRPDVLQAEHQLKAYNANIGAARAAFFPTITLTGSGGTTSLSFANLFGAGSGTWTFTPAITLPIFDAGRNAANLRLAKVQKDTALAQYDKAVQTAFREVADALARRGTIDEQLAAQQALVDAASQSLGLSTARYQRGTDTYLNTLMSQVSLYTARQNLTTTRLTRAMSLVTLYQTLGGGVR